MPEKVVCECAVCNAQVSLVRKREIFHEDQRRLLRVLIDMPNVELTIVPNGKNEDRLVCNDCVKKIDKILDRITILYVAPKQ